MATRTARPPRRSTELLGIVVSCVGGYALLLGLLPALAQGGIGLTLLGFGLFGTLAHVFVTVRAGLSAARAVVEVLVAATVTFAVVYGSMWYFTVYLASQPGIIPFSSPPATP